MRWLVMVFVGAALAAAPALADLSNPIPNLAATDADYAAGKQAMEKKNWPEAAKRFEAALKRNPDSADLHNYPGLHASQPEAVRSRVQVLQARD